MEWNEKLKNARKRAGFTQAQLADAIGVHRSTVANYELARRKPTFIELKQIAKKLNVDVNYLIEGNEVDAEDDFLTRAESIFTDLTITKEDKDKIFQDIMEIYMKGKSEHDRVRKSQS